MVAAYRPVDAKYVEEFGNGFNVVGEVATSGRWEEVGDTARGRGGWSQRRRLRHER